LIRNICLAAGALIVPVAACGDDGSVDDDESSGPSTGPGNTSEIITECIMWPMNQTGGGVQNVGGSGGAGGLAGTGGTGGAGGNAASAGGSGGENVADCPNATDAQPFIQVGGCGSGQVLSDGEYDAAQGACCYQVEIQYCIGRPYIDDNHALVAPAIWGEGDEWCEERYDENTFTNVAPATLLVLAEQWSRDGLAEHASIASFARFALELMAVGAPPELVAAAHAAAIDEVKHARACLSLARRYRGRDVKPGPFPLPNNVAVSSDVADLVARVALEGCVGETIAAMQAAHQLEVATDPEVKRVLAMIAEDEARHAELAWRTVSWALASGGMEMRGAVERALDAGIRAILAEDTGAHRDHDPALAAHGRLDADAITALRRRAIETVVRPCAATILAPSVHVSQASAAS
jgi:hypothetical protein